jgi:hypothetical protein
MGLRRCRIALSLASIFHPSSSRVPSAPKINGAPSAASVNIGKRALGRCRARIAPATPDPISGIANLGHDGACSARIMSTLVSNSSRRNAVRTFTTVRAAERLQPLSPTADDPRADTELNQSTAVPR